MLSVVIPTYQRLPVLREVLAALDRCSRPEEGFEVVVVSDGSTDGTSSFLRDWRPGHPFRWLEQANSGPGRARNRGAAEATGDRILFLGDDTVPDPELLVRHLQRAMREADPAAIAVLGYTDWHPRMTTSPFLRHINEYGLQFGYSIIPDPDDVPFNFFYTSNISLDRRRFLDLHGFDTDFPAAAWEDIEFARRACLDGLRIVYESAARTAHDHPTSVDRFVARQQRAGEVALLFARKHPDLSDFLGLSCLGELDGPVRRRLDLALARLGGRVPWLFSRRVCDRVMRQAYLRGLAAAQQQETPAPTG